MSPYSWIVTLDRTEDKPRQVEVIGPRGSRIPAADIRKGDAFRMLDDDGNAYYEGHIVGDYEGFEPLDDYGMPNAGATSIEYRRDGRWEVL